MLNRMTIDYHQTLPDCLQTTRKQFETEAKMAMVVKLFEMKRLSSGIAAQMVGMDRVTFLLSLHHFGVHKIDLEKEELLLDIRGA
jgi:predicted HTH domain antitoxin